MLPSSRYEDLAIVRRGVEKIVDYSRFIKDDQMEAMLQHRITRNAVIRIHRDCLKKIYHEMKRISNQQETSQPKIPRMRRTRSEDNIFSWKKDCFIGGLECVGNSKYPDRIDWRQVQDINMRKNLLEICSYRTDQMSEKVESRLLSCNDLVAPGARYHFNCRKSFKKHSTSNLTPGRPKDNERLNNFIEVCKWLESEAEVYSLQEIYRKMVDLSDSEENVYSQKWLKTKLKEKYGTYIQFVEDD